MHRTGISRSTPHGRDPSLSHTFAPPLPSHRYPQVNSVLLRPTSPRKFQKKQIPSYQSLIKLGGQFSPFWQFLLHSGKVSTFSRRKHEFECKDRKLYKADIFLFASFLTIMTTAWKIITRVCATYSKTLNVHEEDHSSEIYAPRQWKTRKSSNDISPACNSVANYPFPSTA